MDKTLNRRRGQSLGAYYHITGFVNRGAHSSFCAADHADISKMVDNAEDKLFHKILNNASHVLSQLLTERRNELTNSLRTRRHDRTLSQRATRLTDDNFIIRQLFKNSY